MEDIYEGVTYPSLGERGYSNVNGFIQINGTVSSPLQSGEVGYIPQHPVNNGEIS